MLGWMCERAAGRRMADLISTLIWQPMGAEFDADITCDSVGTAVHDGGISATLRDLARFGQLLLDDGRAGDRQVVPTAWLTDAYTPTPDVREAFAHTDNEPMLPGGWYRDQFWFFHPESGPVLLCLGIHGQLVFVDRATRTVVVKQSSLAGRPECRPIWRRPCARAWRSPRRWRPGVRAARASAVACCGADDAMAAQAPRSARAAGG